MRENLDFETRKNELLRCFEDVRHMAFSTCANDRVTSRVVTTACHGDKIYFLSWNHHVKCVQIRNNPRVAFCHDNIQIEGIASIKGNPLEEKNNIYSEKFQEKQPNIFKVFTKFKGMIIIEVLITQIRSYVENNGQYYLDCVNLAEKTAYRENMAVDL